MKDSLIHLVQRLLKINQIYFDKEELGFQIQSHPSYPSLHAITGVLSHFNIENVAVQIPIDLETLEQLPDCFIAQINEENNKLLVVVERKKLKYEIYSAEHKKEILLNEAFLKKFTGIIVAVEKTEGPQVKEKTSRIGEYIGLSLLVVLAAFLVFNTAVPIYNIVYLLLSIVHVTHLKSISKKDY